MTSCRPAPWGVCPTSKRSPRNLSGNMIIIPPVTKCWGGGGGGRGGILVRKFVSDVCVCMFYVCEVIGFVG